MNACGRRPAASRRARMKRSIGVRFQAGSATAGGVGAARGATLQKRPPSAAVIPCAWPGRRRGRGSTKPSRGSWAPRRTQAATNSISSGASLPSGGICGAPASQRIARIKRLWSGSPGTIAGPESPPWAQPSRRSSRRPPLISSSAAWHPRQRAASSGAIDSVKPGSTTAGSDSAANDRGKDPGESNTIPPAIAPATVALPLHHAPVTAMV